MRHRKCPLQTTIVVVVWYGMVRERERERDPFNCPLSRTTRVSRYQKGKPIWILLKQETVSGSGISWAICKSAHRSRQITMPVAGCPSCRPTNSVKALKALNSTHDVILYPQNSDSIVTVDSVTSIHPMYSESGLSLLDTSRLCFAFCWGIRSADCKHL